MNAGACPMLNRFDRASKFFLRMNTEELSPVSSIHAVLSLTGSAAFEESREEFVLMRFFQARLTRPALGKPKCQNRLEQIDGQALN